MNNKNTTIDKIALSEFGVHYHELSDNLKQWCNLEMVTNKVWLEPFWKKEDYMSTADKIMMSKNLTIS